MKESYRKSVLSVLTTSIVLTSCNPNLIDKPNFSMDKFAVDEENGVSLMPIEVYLGEEYAAKIAFIESFVTNILSDTEVALAFSNNRDSILKQYGLDNMNFDLNSPEIQLLFAMADKDIFNAIEANDVIGYLRILQTKGLFQTSSFKTMMSLLTSINGLGEGDLPDDSDNESGMSPIAICILGLVIYVGVATIAETYIMIHSGFALYGADDNELSHLMIDRCVNNNVLKLWQIKGDKEHMYDLVDNIHNGIVRLTHELGQITGLSEEEQKKFYELAKGTINANDVVEIVNNIDEK